jgi:hypothetical protein
MMRKMMAEEVQEIVAEMKTKYGNKYNKLAKKCIDMPNSKAYNTYMNAMPKNEDEHRWALFMMGTMDEMI